MRGAVSNFMADKYSHDQQIDNLFTCLAEQVKLPFLQVSQAAELISLDSLNIAKNQQTIQEVSAAAIQLIDGFLLQVRMQQESRLDLESVSVSSVMYDTADLLSSYAKLHDCEIRLEVSGRFGPVMSHALGLRSALANIGYSIIDAAEVGKRQTITLGVRKNTGGIMAGVYSDSIDISSALLKQAREMKGQAHQPISGLASGSAAGIFVADSLMTNLGATLKVSKLRGMAGLGASFLPSRQLSLV